jgi:hypothetical protein
MLVQRELPEFNGRIAFGFHVQTNEYSATDGTFVIEREVSGIEVGDILELNVSTLENYAARVIKLEWLGSRTARLTLCPIGTTNHH